MDAAPGDVVVCQHRDPKRGPSLPSWGRLHSPSPPCCWAERCAPAPWAHLHTSACADPSADQGKQPRPLATHCATPAVPCARTHRRVAWARCCEVQLRCRRPQGVHTPHQRRPRPTAAQPQGSRFLDLGSIAAAGAQAATQESARRSWDVLRSLHPLKPIAGHPIACRGHDEGGIVRASSRRTECGRCREHFRACPAQVSTWHAVHRVVANGAHPGARVAGCPPPAIAWAPMRPTVWQTLRRPLDLRPQRRDRSSVQAQQRRTATPLRVGCSQRVRQHQQHAAPHLCWGGRACAPNTAPPSKAACPAGCSHGWAAAPAVQAAKAEAAAAEASPSGAAPAEPPPPASSFAVTEDDSGAATKAGSSGISSGIRLDGVRRARLATRVEQALLRVSAPH